MKFFIVLAVALATAAAAPFDESAAPVVRSEYNQEPEGSYQHTYETGNGIFGQAVGVLKAISGGNPAVVASGSYKYTAPDGQIVETSYVADENGFQPIGSHLPVSPPIPELIARSLQYIAAHPAPAERVIQTPARAVSVASLLG